MYVNMRRAKVTAKGVLYLIAPGLPVLHLNAHEPIRVA